MKTKIILSIGLTALLSGCSGGGGSGSGGGGSSSGQASGPLSIPSATCSGSPCMDSASIMSSSVHASALLSGETVLNMGEIVYTHFKDTIIPGVNTALYQVEQVAASEGLTTCDAIATAGDGDFGGGDSILDYPLGSGYTVDISKAVGDLKTIPAPMTDSGTAMARKFTFSRSGTKFAEVQIKCNSATERTFYVRVQESASKIYEFWSQNDGDKRIIYGAMDNGSSEKITFYFNTADGTTFQLHGVALQTVVAGAAMDFSIAGGADLNSDLADIAYVQGDIVPTTESYSDDDNGSVQPRHCYSSISSVTVDPAASAATTCSGLLSAAGSANAIRSGTAWKLTGMASAISSSF